MLCTWQGNVSISDQRLANIEQYKALGAAIITSAANDYIGARKRHDETEIKSIERFFFSDEFLLLSSGNLNPKTVISALKRKARKS